MLNGRPSQRKKSARCLARRPTTQHHASLETGTNDLEDFVIELFNACVLLCYHPTLNNCRPIVLLDTFGKFLEKIMAKRLLVDATCYNLIPINQFGGRTASWTDAALALLHDVTLAHLAVSLFDIKGFSDILTHNRSASVLSGLGFPSEACGWTCSFLKFSRGYEGPPEIQWNLVRGMGIGSRNPTRDTNLPHPISGLRLPASISHERLEQLVAWHVHRPYFC